ncbi:hypothetical protein [Rhizobium oryzicola]|uniref:Uncharacterized protein n=1 Tax=Rhizobium oryzicola TaxID=1232668 RepID=A0ABT8T0H0_9HYPH|nr:hypothetical protein [Rhizobium oryzicola]MDO1584244.1 hypothetical protein [Rhizobium oryzicola]
MTIVGTQVIAEGSGQSGYTVEFVSEQGDVVSVSLRGQDGAVNRNNAVAKAKVFLEDLVRAGTLPDELVDGENQDGRAATMASRHPAAGRGEPQSQEDMLNEGLEDTFPASDPVSSTITSIPGKAPERH